MPPRKTIQNRPQTLSTPKVYGLINEMVKSEYWQFPQVSDWANNITNVTQNANQLWVMPFYSDGDVDVHCIGVQQGNGASNYQFVFGIYKFGDKGTYGDRYVPHLLIWQSGILTSNGAGIKQVFDTENPLFSLEPGLYGFAILHNSVSQVQWKGVQGQMQKNFYGSGLSSFGNRGFMAFQNLSYPFSSLPLYCPLLPIKINNGASVPIFGIKKP